MSARDVREYILCIGSRTPAKGFANAQIGDSQDEIRPYTACTRRGTQRGSHGLCVRKLQGASGPAYKMLGSLLRSVLPESWYTASVGMDAVAVFTGGTGPVSGTPARTVLASASKNKRAVTGGKLAVHTRPLTAADGRRRVN
jgi:hypothetical protein